MKGFSYLYAIFFVVFLSSVVIGYITSVGSSYIAQKRLVNERYYDSVSRQFLSMIVNQIIRKVNFSPAKIESISELGVLDNGVYFVEIGDVKAKVRLLITEEVVKKYDEYNIIKPEIILYSVSNFSGKVKILSARVHLEIISGKLPFNLFAQKSNLRSVSYFFPYHNSEFYGSTPNKFSIDRLKTLKKVLGLDENPELMILKRLLNKKVDIPIVDGLYIGESNNGDFLYFKGDVDRIVLGIDGDCQFVFAQQKDNKIFIKYKPEDNSYLYLKDDDSGLKNSIFSGNILIEGNVLELSSGKIIGEDIVEDSEVPAVKDGAKINLLIGGGFKLVSSLKYEGVELGKAKFIRKKARLNILQSEKGLFYDNDDSSEVCLEFSDDNPEVHANLYLEGKVENNRGFKLFGALFSKYLFLLNLPEFTEDPLNYSDEDNLSILPLSESDMTFVKSLRVEKIEEVLNE